MSLASNLIDTGALQSALHDADLRVLDCRFDLADPDAGRRDYLNGHIPGAVFADLDRDLSATVTDATGRHPLPAADTFAVTLGRFGIDATTRVVVYDAGNGAMAARAWWMLRWLGHENVRLLDGGFEKWRREERALSAGDEQAPQRSFEAHERRSMIITTAEIAQQLDRVHELRLVDARDAERFRGDVEPIDPVAGHIPGSINLPLTRSLDADGTWKSRAELERLWQDVLGKDKSAPWCVMCGSGVTACHLAISGMQAGYSEPRLYVGSWSEWIRDPARPTGSGHD